MTQICAATIQFSITVFSKNKVQDGLVYAIYNTILSLTFLVNQLQETPAHMQP
jgi:hypothetical protein